MTLILAASLITLAAGLSVAAQDPSQTNSTTNTSQQTTVHGIVRNGASGEPLSHALVRISGDASTGALSDGEGRFEIADVPEGPQEFTIVKPGFMDEEEAGEDSNAHNSHGYGHNVIIGAPMGDVVFTMEPTNAIQGQIQLSTGDVAEGIQLTLLKRAVQDGRAVWQNFANTKTNTEGAYRFGELSDGQYAVYTTPTMDSEAATNLVENGSGNNVPREGFASVYYPDARDLAGAAKIRVAGGEQAQANITLTLEPFQSVTATVTMPSVKKLDGDEVSAQVMDGAGHQLLYSVLYDASTHTVQAALPNGTYSLVANLIPAQALRAIQTASGERFGVSVKDLIPVSGQVAFGVADRAVSNLRLPMSTVSSTPVQVTVAHSPDSAPQSTEPQVYITLTQAGGGTSDGMTSEFAEGRISDLVQNTHPPAGPYWVHTSIAPKILCEGSFTASGVSLSRAPLIINDARSAGAPLVLALRDDCGRLTLSLPGSVGLGVGEEHFYTVYAVPDFDSTEDVVPQTLRPSTGGKITLTGLTPGNYHVYTSSKPVALEYRNPAVMATLRGQPITVVPVVETELTIEVPQR
jgi:Carboxypeptidase regulatory-like domain